MVDTSIPEGAFPDSPIVIRKEDVEKYLTVHQATVLKELCDVIVWGYKKDNLPTRESLVVDSLHQDYELIADILKERVEGRQTCVEGMLDQIKYCENKYTKCQLLVSLLIKTLERAKPWVIEMEVPSCVEEIDKVLSAAHSYQRFL
jgi:hypothetical protein